MPHPGPGQVLLRIRAAGVNYADTMQRAGTYGGQYRFPFVAGFEACGDITEVGPEAAGFAIGQRIGRIAAHVAAKHVAGKLVEHDDERQRTVVARFPG